jgi:PAS domain S-box-containing protein
MSSFKRETVTSTRGTSQLDKALSEPAATVFTAQRMARLCMENIAASVEERVYFKDLASRFLLVSEGWLEAIGESRSLEDAIGKTDHDFFSAPHADKARADEQAIIATGEPIVGKHELETFSDRPDLWAQTTKMALRDEHGMIVGTWGITRDVTAQMQAEAALRASREELQASELMLRVLFEQAPLATCIYDASTLQIVAVNDAAIATYGFSREEFLTMTIMDAIPPEDRELFAGVAQRRRGPERAGARSTERQRHVCKDGTIIEVEVTTSEVVLDGRACRVGSSLDVTERNRAAAEVEAALDRAVEASNMKSAFLATISHEIRTPMNGVLGMTELLLDTKLDDDQREIATQVSHSGELMLDLMNDILDIAKIEAGQLQLELDDYPLRETIEMACAVAVLQADAKGVQFDVQIADEVPLRTHGDGRRLRQVLVNLVSNAVKFTSEGTITVYASTLPQFGAVDVLRIDVSDSGIGIDAANLDRMFEPFTQADASTTRAYGGTGLGLSIAGELVELMGGTIGAQSELGRGSSFWIELPLMPAVVADRRRAQRRPHDRDPRQRWATTPVVLVAEDSPVNQIVAARTLERCGCEFDVAGDGAQALEMLAGRHYDAVLMDCQMPTMDGYEATAALRRREGGGRRVPVIAMTARAMDGDRARCLAAGMDDYISKPIRREQLIETLSRWLPARATGQAPGTTP